MPKRKNVRDPLTNLHIGYLKEYTRQNLEDVKALKAKLDADKELASKQIKTLQRRRKRRRAEESKSLVPSYTNFESILEPKKTVSTRSVRGFRELIFEPYGYEVHSRLDTKEYIRSAVKYVVDHYGLEEKTLMYVVVINEESGGYARSSHEIPYSSLKEWINKFDTTDYVNYGSNSDVTDPKEIIVGWEEGSIPAGYGEDLELDKKRYGRIMKKSFSFDTQLCAGISLILLSSKWESEQARNRWKCKYNCLPSAKSPILDEEDRMLQDKMKKWKRLDNQSSAKDPKSKITRERHSLAKDLFLRCNIDPNKGATYDEVSIMSKQLTFELSKVWNRQLVSSLVIFNHLMGKVYSDHDFDSNPNLVYYLCHHDGHYQAIVSPSPLMTKSKNYSFCISCQALKHIGHKCIANCPKCGIYPNHCLNDSADLILVCESCNRSFPTEECLHNHKQLPKKGLSVCDSIWMCNGCQKIFCHPRKCTKTEHDCNANSWCGNCGKWVFPWPEHQCYIRTKASKKSVGTKKLENGEEIDRILYADIECQQVDDYKEGKERNVPIKQKDHNVNLICTVMSNGQIWKPYDKAEEWLSELMSMKWEGFNVVFHNGSGYDIFILAGVLERMNIKYKPHYMDGSRLRSLTIYKTGRNKHVKFMDSMCHIGMKLSKFTVTFGLQSRKGEFPHGMNTPNKLHWKGLLSDIPLEEFWYSRKSTEPEDFLDENGKKYKSTEQAELKKWYDNRCKEGYIWDNYKEFVDYCIADAMLLRDGCQKARMLKMKACDTDPFCYLSVAAACKAIFLDRFLPQDTIACLPVWLVKDLTPGARGGRVDGNRMFWKAKPGQRAFHVDFNSQYGYINAECIYPNGHPSYHICQEEGKNIENNHKLIQQDGLGILFVDVTCPQTLRHPILHVLEGNKGIEGEEGVKLLFDLSDKKYQIYTSLELRKAIQLGYKVTRIYKYVWWTNTINGIFRDYINYFFRLKTEAEGMKDRNDEWLEQFYQHRGIRLEKDKMEENPGMRQEAKAAVVSLWGKMGERLDYDSHDMLREDNDSIDKWDRYILEDKLKCWRILSESTVIVTLKPEERHNSDFVIDRNIAIAIFTTAHGRLMLYEKYLEPLQHRVLYYDTDSCIFYMDEGESPYKYVPINTMLGDPVSEIGTKASYSDPQFPKDGDRDSQYIVEFCCNGPKSYQYKIQNGKGEQFIKFKAKGMPYSRADVREQLTYDRIIDTCVAGAHYLQDFTGVHVIPEESVNITELISRCQEEHAHRECPSFHVNIPNVLRRTRDFHVITTDMHKVFRNAYTKQQVDTISEWEITLKPWTNESKPYMFALIKELSKHQSNE